jgi:hypothetical protein
MVSKVKKYGMGMSTSEGEGEGGGLAKTMRERVKQGERLYVAGVTKTKSTDVEMGCDAWWYK